MGIPVDSSPTFHYNCTTSSPALSSPPSNSSSPSTPCSRCRGLDLLAMAALGVAGVAEDVEESNSNEENCKDSSNNKKLAMEVKVDMGVEGVEFGPTLKRSRRQALMPPKYQDSVLQPWKRGSRRRRSPPAATRLG